MRASTFGGKNKLFFLYDLKDPPPQFSNLLLNSISTVIKFRYSFEVEHFIKTEIDHLLEEQMTGPSNSFWRAQKMVNTNKQHKQNGNYSQTVNRFALYDVYSFGNGVLSSLDFKSAYDQVPIRAEDKAFTAFIVETCSRSVGFPLV